MSRPIFAFGPSQYYLACSGNYKKSSFPTTIINHVGAQNENVDSFLACAFGRGDRHFLAYRNTEKAIAHCENRLPPRLKKWLVADGKLCRDADSLLVSFGDDESFFAMDKDGFCWAQLPSLLEEVLQESIGLEGWKAAPKLVVLGARGSYVYVNSKGVGHSHLGSSYARLKTYLSQPDGLHGQIEYVSLDVNNGVHSVALVKDKPHHYDVPAHLDATAKLFATKLPEFNYQAPETVDGLRAEHIKLKSLKGTLDADLTTLRTRNQTLETEHATLKSQHAALDADHTKLKSRNEAVEDDHAKLKFRNESLEGDHARLKSRHETLDVDHTKLKARNEAVELEHAKLKSQHETLDAECTRVKARNATLEEDSRRLKSQDEALQGFAQVLVRYQK